MNDTIVIGNDIFNDKKINNNRLLLIIITARIARRRRKYRFLKTKEILD